MTLLGAVVFGGLLGIAVLWLLVTAPENDVDGVWEHTQWQQPADLASASAGPSHDGFTSAQ